MRHGSGNRRQRSRGNGRRNNNGAPNRSQVFDSNGPDVRIRGTAHQIVEKYAALAKDAASSGDRTLSENYLQHAEHYQRIIVSWDEMDRSRQEQQNKNQVENDADEDLSLPASMLTKAPAGQDDAQEEMA